MRIGPKLLLQFLSVALLGTVLGGLGVGNLLFLKSQVGNTYGRGTVALSNLVMLSEAFLKLDLQVRDLVVARDAVDRQTAAVAVQDARKTYERYHSIALTLVLDDMDRYNFAELDLAYQRYEEALGRVVSAAPEDIRPAGLEVSRRIHAISDYVISTSQTWSETTRSQVVATITIMAVVSILYLLAALLLSLLLSRGIAASLAQVSSLLARLEQGNLGGRATNIVLRRRDEIGWLGRDVNSLAISLEKNVRSIAEVGDSLHVVAGHVDSQMTATASATAVITDRVEAVERRIVDQGSMVAKSEAVALEVISKIGGLDRLIEIQSGQVTESSSSVEEILNNLREFSMLVGSLAESFSLLLVNSEQGREKLDHTAESAHQISEESRKLQDANLMVKTLAEQTNLLAMNAAIEAAHAGDAGRGFAVVAEEIRRLAESSSSQSIEINEDIRSIQSHIDKMVEATGDTQRSLDSTINRIVVLSQIERTLSIAVRDQSEGSHRILEATQRLERITSEVKDGSARMLMDCGAIGQEMAALRQLSGDIRTDMEEILSETNAIVGAVVTGAGWGVKNTEMARHLREQMERFHFG